MAIARTSRRLPGFRFEAQPPPLAETLPRMDVAVFVGFAAAGPLQQPVVVEDATQFANIFGGDLPLAWDETRGERINSYLAPAVHAFFRNGGRRCWVIRIAGRARANLFPIPGLVRVRADGTLVQAYAAARAVGSWSDSLRTGALLQSLPLVVSGQDSPTDLQLDLTAPEEVSAGDLLRLSYGDKYLAMAVVDSVARVETSNNFSDSAKKQARRIRVKVRAGVTQWFRLPGAAPETETGRAHLLTGGGRRRSVRATVPDDFQWHDGQPVSLNLELTAVDAPAPGALVRAVFGESQLWLLVGDVRVLGQRSEAEKERVQVSGEALWRLSSAPEASALGLLRTCEKLLFELRASPSDAAAARISGLGFTARHPRFWSALPTDEQLYRDPSVRVEAATPLPQRALWLETESPRFSLAGRGGSGRTDAVYLPLGMPAFSGNYLGPLKRQQSALVRDGLADFNTDLFLDPHLKEFGIEDLLTQADFLRYQSPRPVALRGIHAALGIEEATIICVPDVVHRGWHLTEEKMRKPQSPTPLPHPEWWRYLDCLTRPDIDPLRQPERGHFFDCRQKVIAPPHLQSELADEVGTIMLTWSSALEEREYIVEEATMPDWRGARVVYAGAANRVSLQGRDPEVRFYYRVRMRVAGIASEWLPLESMTRDEGGALTLEWPSLLDVKYVLEEATAPDWGNATPVYTGLDNRRVIYGRHEGHYYYRVRAEVDGMTSDWSEPVGVRVAAGSRWQLNPTAVYQTQTLLEVQCALLRMCAARGDLFAVLSLPEHYREEEATRHIGALTPSALSPRALPAQANLIAPLGYGERRALSYGALYHPWLVIREESARAELRHVPPDAAAAGILARRALERGAWIAPANEPLRGVVALTPTILPAARGQLQQAQINLIRQEPHGFLSLSADTLDETEELRPIGVRRLLILLRRLALRLGAAYVFEPNSDAFRRLVKRGFEGLLGEMFARGAFAGATPATSYQVNTGSELNTRQLLDQGRFIVELKVAPSLPLTFLTLRLVQTGDRGLTTEE